MNKIVMYDYWYEYTKPKHEDKAKLCCMDMDSLIIQVKSEKTSMQTFYEMLRKDLIC